MKSSTILASSRFAILECPVIATATTLACGSTTDLQIHVQASSYSPTDTTSEICDGSSLGLTLTYTVPVECPTCPATSNYFGAQACDMASNMGCNYQAVYFGGGSGPLPCYCALNATTGARTWSCAVS